MHLLDLAIRDLTSVQRYIDVDDVRVQVEVVIAKARVMMKIMQEDEAIKCCLRAMELDQECASAYQYMGIISVQRGKYTDAIRWFAKTLGIMPHYQTLVMRGKAYLAVNDRVRALIDFTNAIEISPNLAIAYGNRADVLGEMERYDLAVLDITNWIRGAHKEDTISARLTRGSWLCKLKRYREAIDDFSFVLDFDSNHTSARTGRAIAYSHLRQHQKSVADWLLVLKEKPDWLKAHRSIAKEYESLRDYVNCIHFLSNSIKLEPQNSELYHQRANIFSYLGLFEQALLDLSFSLKIDSRNSALYKSRAYIFSALNQFENSLTDLNSAIVLDPLNPTYYEMRCALFWKMKKSFYGKTDLLQAKRLRRKMRKTKRLKL
jgi:tetratricopeptide (TPR) repeat protein